jgi:hypothetical protein
METKVKAAGSDEWKRLADFPEITAPGGGPTPSPAQTPAAAAALAQLPALARPLDVLGCYERSWNLLKANFWPLIGASLLYAILAGCLVYTQFRGVLFVSAIFSGLLTGGIEYRILRSLRGENATVGDVFAGFTRAPVALVISAIVMSVFVTVGLICLIIPGIFLAVAYSLTYINAVDKKLGFWEAMEASRKAVMRQWWPMFGVVLLGIPFFLAGALALGIGVLVAIPLVFGAVACAYEDLCNPKR